MAECRMGTYRQPHQNILLTGATGRGKTDIACALGEPACRQGRTARYWRWSRLLDQLPIARADGSYHKLLGQLARNQLLIVDDGGREKRNAKPATDRLNVPFLIDYSRYEGTEERPGRRSTIICNQLPIDQWHELIGDPTLADAILDRLVHNAYKINLKGESMRKQKSLLTENNLSE